MTLSALPTLPSPADQTGRGANSPSVCVVVPIPNDPPWELFDAIPPEIPIIVSDDSDGRLAPPPRANVHYFDYAAQEAYAGSHYAAMPHKSAASRNIGHYIAWKEGFDVIIALDYDCQTRPGWLEAHLGSLGRVDGAPGVRPVADNGWVNPIMKTFDNGDTVYARGYPYEWRTPALAQTRSEPVSGQVALNLGVWDGILDLNGIDKLYAGEPGDPGVPAGRSRIALGNIPICGMNTAFVRELTPAYYFLPDLWVNGWQLSRHDDIWGGYITKRLMDLRGDLLAYGGPVVGHTKQTRLERVVVLEQWMHLMSMPFYDIVDEAASRVEVGDYADMFAHFVEEYARGVESSRAPSHYREVYRQLGDWMTRWAAAFR
jgi:Reversibly glycosylated polypeptide